MNPISLLRRSGDVASKLLALLAAIGLLFSLTAVAAHASAEQLQPPLFLEQECETLFIEGNAERQAVKMSVGEENLANATAVPIGETFPITGGVELYFFVAEDGGEFVLTYSATFSVCPPPRPEPVVDLGEWQGGTPSCDDPTVTQSRRVTTTKYVLSDDGSEWVLGDPVTTTETRQASLSEDELAECASDPDPVIDPAGKVTIACEGDGVAVLDNSKSTTQVGFEVVVNGKATLLVLRAGEVRHVPVTGAKPGTTVVVQDGEGNKLASAKVPTCDVTPEPDPTTTAPAPDPTDTMPRLDEALAERFSNVSYKLTDECVFEFSGTYRGGDGLRADLYVDDDSGDWPTVDFVELMVPEGQDSVEFSLRAPGLQVGSTVMVMVWSMGGESYAYLTKAMTIDEDCSVAPAPTQEPTTGPTSPGSTDTPTPGQPAPTSTAPAGTTPPLTQGDGDKVDKTTSANGPTGPVVETDIVNQGSSLPWFYGVGLVSLLALLAAGLLSPRRGEH